MGKQRSPEAQWFVDNAHLSNEELRERVVKVFPEFDLNDKHKFGNYRRRALEIVEREKTKPAKKKAAKKKTKPKDSVSRSPAAFDLLETPDAKQLMNLLLRVGLNTADAVIERFRHIVDKQQA